MKTITLLTFAACTASAAAAQVTFEAEGAVSSAVFDRGEQLTESATEFEGRAGIDVLGGQAYAGVYWLRPFGDEEDAFAEEVDYIIGYVADTAVAEIDVSVNYLTFSGDGVGRFIDDTTEIIASAAFKAPLTPTVTGFYDTNDRYGGVEGSLEQRIPVFFGWSAGVLGRAGVVDPADGADTWVYAGVEGDLTRSLGPADLSLYARYERADQENFVDMSFANFADYSRNDGLAAGVRLLVQRQRKRAPKRPLSQPRAAAHRRTSDRGSIAAPAAALRERNRRRHKLSDCLSTPICAGGAVRVKTARQGRDPEYRKLHPRAQR